MPTHRVYLVRHAKAEPGDSSTDDAARRLTVEGRTRFHRLIGALGGRLQVRKVITSPYVRAHQTAAMLASATRAAIVEDERLASGASEGPELLALVRQAEPDTALVGHNPEIAEALAKVAGKDLEVKPGSIAALKVEGKQIALEWLETPEKG